MLGVTGSIPAQGCRVSEDVAGLLALPLPPDMILTFWEVQSSLSLTLGSRGRQRHRPSEWPARETVVMPSCKCASLCQRRQSSPRALPRENGQSRAPAAHHARSMPWTPGAPGPRPRPDTPWEEQQPVKACCEEMRWALSYGFEPETSERRGPSGRR